MRANNFFIKAVLISFALFLSSIASAQTATVNVVMAPTATATQGEVDNFVPGAAPFVLMIKATETATTNYRYTVVATKEDGSTKVVNGQVSRADNNAGFTVTPVSLGVDAATVCVTVSEL